MQGKTLLAGLSPTQCNIMMCKPTHFKGRERGEGPGKRNDGHTMLSLFRYASGDDLTVKMPPALALGQAMVQSVLIRVRGVERKRLRLCVRVVVGVGPLS